MPVRKRANNKYLAYYRGSDGRERSKIFDRKTDAERWARAELAKIDRGDWTDPRLGQVKIGDYAAEWLASKVKIKPSTRATYDALLRTHVLPVWGRVPLAGVRHEDVAAWVQRLHSSGLSASRTRQAFVVFAQVLDLAVRSRRIPANVARGVELPSLTAAAHERGEMRALTEEEIWTLADAAGEQRLAVLVLGWCGLRFGELAGLRVKRVNLLGRELRIEVALSEIGGKLTEGTPKTRGSRRTVPLPVWLADELAPLLENKGPEDYLLTAAEGGPLRGGNWRRRVFDPAVRAAGLASQTTGDMLRPHDLRHTAASLHIKHGTPPKVLSALLGHASVAITLDRYGHLYPGDAAGYVDKLGDVALASRADWVRTRSADRVVSLPRLAEV